MERPAEGACLPLCKLEGQPLANSKLSLRLGPTNPAGARYFQVFLRDAHGRTSTEPALLGLYHTGPEPAHNWIEVFFLAREVVFPVVPGLSERRISLAQAGLEEPLVAALARLIPPGGHLMLEYESHPQTRQALELGVPPVATPLGTLLFRIGCGTNIRDWYIPEGGKEGGRKLQGYKALHREHARRRARQMAQELLDFLARAPDPRQAEVHGPARQRAVEILASLDTGDAQLDRKIREALAAGGRSQ